MRILYNSNEIRQTVTELFVDSSVRRVAIVAFVGEGAESFLPNPKGLELVCWAKAGGTSADSIRRLKQRGAKVSFAHCVHMKLYWAENKGAVITSANLSTNALGSGNLHEIGVLVSCDAVDIDRILRAVQPRAIKQQDLQRLDKESREIEIAIRKASKTQPQAPQIKFREWYELPSHREWKLGWWDEEGATALVAQEISKLRYGVADPKDSLACKKTDYHVGDWMLTFGLIGDQPSGMAWRTVDFIVKVPTTDKKAYTRSYPYQAIQVWALKYYPLPPFALDSKFKAAFKKAVSEYGADAIKKLKTTRVPNWIIKRMYELYQAA